MGYLPGTLWIIVGVVLAGAVQDYLVLFFSMRRGGRSLGQMARDELGVVGGVAAVIATLAIMIILIAVLALVVVQALGESPWGVFSVAMTIPIALFMGFYLRYLRPGKVGEVSMIGVGLLLLAIVAGGWIAESGLAETFTLSRMTLAWCVVIYGVVAAVLPVWMLLAPRDYLSTFMKVGTIVLLAVAVVVVRPDVAAPAFSEFVGRSDGPVVPGPLFPFLFVTIACGALSGFHALISSGTTPKLIEKERQTRFIGYGGMLMESFVAIMALVAAISIDRGIYFAMNAPTALTGGTVETAAVVGQLARPHRGRHRAPGAGRDRGDGGRAEHRVADGRCPDAGPGSVADPVAVPGRRRARELLVPLRDHVRGAVHPHRRGRRHPGGALHAAGRGGDLRPALP